MTDILDTAVLDAAGMPWWRSPGGEATLVCGDNALVLPLLDRDCVVVVDPPYGMGWNTDSTRFSGGADRERYGNGRSDWDRVVGDDKPFDPEPFLEFKRVAMWGYNHFANKLPSGTTLVWTKKLPHLYGTFLSDAELCWVKGGCGVYVKEFSFPTPVRIAEGGGKTLHPCQKPVEIMQWSAERAGAKAGDTIFDGYMGSGTCGLAALRMGCRYLGIECHEPYFDIARTRIALALGQEVPRADGLVQKRLFTQGEEP